MVSPHGHNYVACIFWYSYWFSPIRQSPTQDQQLLCKPSLLTCTTIYGHPLSQSKQHIRLSIHTPGTPPTWGMEGPDLTVLTLKWNKAGSVRVVRPYIKSYWPPNTQYKGSVGRQPLTTKYSWTSCFTEAPRFSLLWHKLKNCPTLAFSKGDTITATSTRKMKHQQTKTFFPFWYNGKIKTSNLSSTIEYMFLTFCAVSNAFSNFVLHIGSGGHNLTSGGGSLKFNWKVS